jgi:hypothetical protein
MLMRARKKLLLFAFAGLLLAYAVVAFSPIKVYIGRHNPETASYFSPPLLNFSHTYRDGRVLEFQVGMRKEDLFSTLSQRYGGEADLTVNCVVTTADSVVPILPGVDIGAVYGGGSRLCTRLDSRKLSIVFDFRDAVVSAIDVTYVRTEGL